jgi:hypothetical protein
MCFRLVNISPFFHFLVNNEVRTGINVKSIVPIPLPC